MTESETTIERLARLETKVHLKFLELDKALVLAATNIEKEKVQARDQTKLHFDEVNQFQKRMDKMADQFATREWVLDKLESINKRSDERFDRVNKLIYIGVGLATAIGLMLKFAYLLV